MLIGIFAWFKSHFFAHRWPNCENPVCVRAHLSGWLRSKWAVRERLSCGWIRYKYDGLPVMMKRFPWLLPWLWHQVTWNEFVTMRWSRRADIITIMKGMRESVSVVFMPHCIKKQTMLSSPAELFLYTHSRIYVASQDAPLLFFPFSVRDPRNRSWNWRWSPHKELYSCPNEWKQNCKQLKSSYAHFWNVIG